MKSVSIYTGEKLSRMAKERTDVNSNSMNDSEIMEAQEFNNYSKQVK